MQPPKKLSKLLMSYDYCGLMLKRSLATLEFLALYIGCARIDKKFYAVNGLLNAT